MAPPKHDSSDRHDAYHDYLVANDIKDNPRLGKNADQLSAWLEFLLHPETHDEDREVYGPFGETGGTWVWREQPERMYNYDTGDGEEFPFRSVLHEYRYSDFLDPLVAVSTQQVESGKSLLALATAAVSNIYWAGGKFTHELANFPSEWDSPAAVEAKRFVSRLESVAGQLNLVVGELKDLLPKYAMLIKGVRMNLNKTVEALVAKFEEKYATKPPDGFSFDITGLALALIATTATTFMTGGAGAVLGEALVVKAWEYTFDAVATELFYEDPDHPQSIGQINGYWWKDLAKSYLTATDGILREATSAMEALNGQLSELATNFAKALPKFEDTLPQVEQGPTTPNL